MKQSVYLDYNATTPVDQRVLDSMLPYFTERFGNASSRTHAFGWLTEEAVEIAREQVAALIGSEKNEIIFTSGATESVNLAIKGVFEAYQTKGSHIITWSTEHKAVLDTCKHLQQSGAEITILPAGSDGLPDLNLLSEKITDKTILVCAMMANNETGVLFPVQEISKIVHEKNSLLMSDCTQACGKIPVDVNISGIDLLCLSSHKMYGPKGSGAVYIRRKNPRVQVMAQIHGGGHEKGLRSGTLNVPGIVGLGKAAELSRELIPVEFQQMQKLRDQLEKGLLKIPGVKINGSLQNRLPNTSNLCIEGIQATQLIRNLSQIAFATGSACSSALPEASHVLLAMGISKTEALSSVRLTLGRFTTSEEIEFAVMKITETIHELRN